MREPVTQLRSIFRYADTSLLNEQDEVAMEFPLTILVDVDEFATMVCTPTLALDLAHDLGITVAGFVRGDTLNIYTHPERIKGTLK